MFSIVVVTMTKLCYMQFMMSLYSLLMSIVDSIRNEFLHKKHEFHAKLKNTEHDKNRMSLENKIENDIIHSPTMSNQIIIQKWNNGIVSVC